MRKRWLIRGALIAAAVVLGFGVYYFTSGLDVAVVNEGASPMRGVVVHVTGKVYPLGDIPAGGKRSVRVEPVGTSNIEMEFRDAGDRQVRLNVNGNFGPGSRGSITVHLKDGAIVKVEGLPGAGGR